MAHMENALLKDEISEKDAQIKKLSEELEKSLAENKVLNEKSYEAYIVGGAIRDLYLELDFNDIDIATNATPQAIKSIFTDCVVDMQYEHLGSVILKIDNFKYEITRLLL